MSVGRQCVSIFTVFCVAGWQGNDVSEGHAAFISIYLEEVGSSFLTNYCTCLQNCTVSQLRNLQCAFIKDIYEQNVVFERM